MNFTRLAGAWGRLTLIIGCASLAFGCGGHGARAPQSAPAPEATHQVAGAKASESSAPNGSTAARQPSPPEALPALGHGPRELPALKDHESALVRQLAGPWGAQRDRDNQARFPLIDSDNWKRVRFRGVPHFTAFTYGEDHNLVSSAFVVKTEGKPTSRRCMALFESEAMREYATLGGRRSAIGERKTRWHGRELLVHTGDGELSILFSNYRFSVAWAAYPAYDDGCLVYATVVLWGDNPALARRVRDRWVLEGFERYVATTASVPERRSN